MQLLLALEKLKELRKRKREADAATSPNTKQPYLHNFQSGSWVWPHLLWKHILPPLPPDDNQVATFSDNFIIMYNEDVLNFSNHELSWVIDSWASVHATSWWDLFTTYTFGEFSEFRVVKMGNDGVSEVFSIGDLRLETNNGTKLVLKMWSMSLIFFEYDFY